MALNRSYLRDDPRRQSLAYLVAACFSGLLVVAPLSAQDSQEKIDVDDVSRSYVVHLPKSYDQQQHYPVVIVLHGRNQDADDMARLTHFNQFADKDSIIVVYPNSAHGQWNIGVRPEQVNQGMQPRRGGGHPPPAAARAAAPASLQRQPRPRGPSAYAPANRTADADGDRPDVC